MESLLVLGRQPELGLTELESLYGAAAIRPVGTQSVIVRVDPCLLAFDRLGGSKKFCKVLTTLQADNWQAIEQFLLSVAPDQSQRMPPGKMYLGLSVYDFPVNLKQLSATGLQLKRAITATGRSVRFIPNKTTELTSAQVIHNHLTGPNGWELVCIKDGHQTIIAQTVKVQDIASYTKRDRNRPQRNSKVGMLPPKLAQIILNLAVGRLPAKTLQSICDIPAGTPIPPPQLNQTILDPFCGSGVMLQEALLMGYAAYGTDIEQAMVQATKTNLHWLKDNFAIGNQEIRFETANARRHTWIYPFDFIASETYLGPPLSGIPNAATLEKTMQICDQLMNDFLSNLAPQLAPKQRLCLAVPAWPDAHGGYRHLSTLDHLKDIGYTQVTFEHTKRPLIYHRTGQFVARELVVMNRN
jgi:tRNA (guanine10-N2)-dimethyltransferase